MAKQHFETRKLYFGFPVFFLGYKDDQHGYNLTTSSSIYSLGSMLVIAMRTKSNAMMQIQKHQHFTVNLPTKELMTEIEIAGFNSHQDKFALTGLHYAIGTTVDAPVIDECLVAIECQVIDYQECGALTNLIARVTNRQVDDSLIDPSGSFKGDCFSPVSYMGDGQARFYRFYDHKKVKMGTLISDYRQQQTDPKTSQG